MNQNFNDPMDKQIIKLRHQRLTTFQIAEKVDYSIGHIEKICKRAGLGGQWLKNMKKIETKKLNKETKKLEKEEIQRRKEFIEKFEKVPLDFVDNRPKEFIDCLNNRQDPIALSSNLSLKQRRIKAKHDKMAEQIVRSKGFEPDKGIVRQEERPDTRSYKDYTGKEPQYFSGRGKYKK